MTIGIDVDGVLADVSDYQLKIGAKFFMKKYGYGIIDPDAFDVKDIFGCTEQERRKFGWRTIWTYIIRYPARDNASEIICKLKSDGHKICIITGRVFAAKENFFGWLSRSLLKNWLKRRRIPYDEIFYCSEHYSERDKMLGCEKHAVNVMIEDNADNIMALRSCTRVICFDAAYNRDCEGENIARAKDWNEVYRLINEMASAGR